MKYIDAEKLITEIERLKSILANPLCSQRHILGPDWVAGGNKMLNEISSVVTSFQQEQPEVDLEKEIDDYIGSHFSEAHDGVLLSDASRMELAITDIAPMARHFYKLGINARKEE